MDNKEFFHSFFFKQFHFNRPRHTDNATNRCAANHYIGHLLHGSGKLVCGSRVVTIQEGDVIYIPMGCRYHSYWYPDESGNLQWNSFGFTCFPDADNHRYLLQTLKPDRVALGLLEQMGAQLGNRMENIGLLYSFLSRVINQMVPDADPAGHLVQKAVAAMRADPHCRIDGIAKACGINQTALYNGFQRILGITPNTMRQRLLCEKAQELLVTTNLSVERISSLTGFSSSSYFRKVLFQHTGKTPLQLRKENSL